MPLVDNCLLPTRDYLFTLPLYHTLDNFRNLELLAKEYDFMEFSTMGPL